MAPTAQDTERLLTIPEVAERLGTSPAYVYARIREGALPFVDLATNTRAKWRVRPADLAAFIDARTASAT